MISQGFFVLDYSRFVGDIQVVTGRSAAPFFGVGWSGKVRHSKSLPIATKSEGKENR
jgi:hypothetical protein